MSPPLHTLPMSAWLLAAVPLAWLVPNHYPPWNSAWSEGVAIVLLCAAGLFAPAAGRMARPLAFAFIVSLASVGSQWAQGRIFFAGDAVMALMYLSLFALSTALASALRPEPAADDRADVFVPLAYGVVVAACLSVGIALAQWTHLVGGGVLFVEKPPADRPFGNLAQSNHFGTACFMALAAGGFLRQRGRIGALSHRIVTAWLLFGIVMAASRTGWLQVALFTLAGIWQGPRLGLAISRRELSAWAVVFAAAVLAWPAVNELSLLDPGRNLEEAMQGNSRKGHWLALADAALRRPWFGWGWQQTSVAQFAVAADHPPVREHLEHAHNLVLDLILWAGLPVGLAITAALGWWLWKRWHGCQESESHWWLVALTGLVIHALLEYPLEYAYFLIPAGILAGAIESRHRGSPRGALVSRTGLRSVALGMSLLTAFIVKDYLTAEEGFRTLRLESAGIGTTGFRTPPPELVVLNQLEAFQRFVQIEASAGLSSEDLRWLQTVSARYAHPPALFRRALAEALNGQPEAAARTLRTLCHMHVRARCEEARTLWPQLRERYPQTAAVPPP